MCPDKVTGATDRRDRSAVAAGHALRRRRALPGFSRARWKSADDSALAAMTGVRRVVRLPDAVAVVAQSWWQLPSAPPTRYASNGTTAAMVNSRPRTSPRPCRRARGAARARAASSSVTSPRRRRCRRRVGRFGAAHRGRICGSVFGSRHHGAADLHRACQTRWHRGLGAVAGRHDHAGHRRGRRRVPNEQVTGPSRGILGAGFCCRAQQEFVVLSGSADRQGVQRAGEDVLWTREEDIARRSLPAARAWQAPGRRVLDADGMPVALTIRLADPSFVASPVPRRSGPTSSIGVSSAG